ncbi:hypothetical protein Aperf_G00000035279 [Anoplocephala perfoliata]
MVKVGNFGDMSMADYQAANQIWLDLCLVDPRMQIGGVCVMIDFSGIKKEAMKQLFDPKLSKAGTRYTQECLPFRVNKLIYYNMPKIFESLFNFYAEWLNEKIRSRIVALSDDLTPAFEAVPGLKDLVPKSLGGNCKYSFDEICERNLKILQTIPAMGIDFDISVDESKRSKENKFSFGVYKDIPSDVMGKSGIYIKLNDEI